MPKEAITHFQNVLALEPKFIDARIQLIELFIEEKNNDEAFAVYESLKKIPSVNNETQKKITALGQMISKIIKSNNP
jgi:hypothetical protein